MHDRRQTMKNKVILFNPRSAKSKHRIPNTILQLGAALEGKFDYVFVDGNREKDPWTTIYRYLESGQFKYFGCTTMPALQLKQAIPFSKKIRQLFPDVVIIWGGYFAGNQYQAAVRSGYVDYVVSGPGDEALPALLSNLEANKTPYKVNNLIFRQDEEIIKTPEAPIPDQNLLPPLPYEKLAQTYSMDGYLGKTCLGNKTAAYHSSAGCPFFCSFCAVVPIYKARWKSKSAQKVYEDIKYLKETYGADAVEFHDNNFFVSEQRVVEFARLIKPENMTWWGEARIDTVNHYSDDSLRAMRESGCKMIFFGAETGNDEILRKMNKGGSQSGEQIKKFAARLAKFDIIPEYSFVLGTPADTPEQVTRQIDSDIAFIKEIKEINPATEIIIYVYSPVPTEGSELFDAVKKSGFRFPEKLEDWLSPEWENFDLRKNPLTPWLTPEMIEKILNFETVLNARFPTVSDIKLSGFQRRVMKTLSRFRYEKNWFRLPYELKLLQRFWLRYRHPEVEGF